MRRTSRTIGLLVASGTVLSSVLSGCGADDGPADNPSNAVLTIDGKVCGLLDAASVETAVGIDDFTADGSGIGPLPGAGQVRGVTCHIGFGDGQHAQDLLSIDASDPYDRAMWHRWRDRVESTYRDHVADASVVAGERCTRPAIIQKSGDGFACISDQRTYLDVLLAHREITMTVTAAQSGTPRARVAAALALVEQVDANLAAHDQASP